MLAAVVAVGRVKINALIEAHVHAAFNDRLVGLIVFRVRQANILNVTAFTQMEALEFMVLFFKRRNIFRAIQVERIREVFRAVELRRGEFID